MHKAGTRNYGMDNLKFILIFCVVLGHMLENANFSCAYFIYKAIYTFHMPAFIFISAFFAKNNSKKTFLNYSLIYILFQVLYILYKGIATNNSITIQFAIPEWIMWYLVCIMLYTLLIPVYDVKTNYQKYIILAISFIIGIAAGFDKSISYTASLSRFFVFQPYFIMGYYYRQQQQHFSNSVCKFFNSQIPCAFICLITVAIATVAICTHDTKITIQQCYCSYPYSTPNDLFSRIKLYITGVIVISALLSIAKIFLDTKIPFVSAIGRNTFPIYLLHGFIVRLDRYKIINFPDKLWVYILTAITIIFLLGNNLTAKLFRYILPSEILKCKLQKHSNNKI